MNSIISKFVVVVAALVFLVGTAVQAQVGLSSLSYIQNFSALGSASAAWTDNTTITGWYASTSNSSAVTPYTAYSISGGGGTSSTTLYAFGSTGSSERALGAAPSTATYTLVGLRLVNDTGSILGGVNVSYDGEQWRQDVNAVSTISFDYQIFSPSGGNLSTLSGWTAVPALGFTSLVAGTAGAIDGNLPANRTAGINTDLTSLNLQPNDELWLKWSYSKTSGGNIDIGIDNVVVSPVPEPGAFALAGLGLLAVAHRLRRGRKL